MKSSKEWSSSSSVDLTPIDKGGKGDKQKLKKQPSIKLVNLKSNPLVEAKLKGFTKTFRAENNDNERFNMLQPLDKKDVSQKTSSANLKGKSSDISVAHSKFKSGE